MAVRRALQENLNKDHWVMAEGKFGDRGFYGSFGTLFLHNCDLPSYSWLGGHQTIVFFDRDSCGTAVLPFARPLDRV